MRPEQDEPSLNVVVLSLLISLPAVSAVLFTPALPDIKMHFAISTATAQWTVTLFLLGYTFVQLIAGPLANTWGRKKTFYVSLITAMLGSILCVTSSFMHSFTVLLLGRLFMSLGSGANLTLVMTLIGDVYSPKQARAFFASVGLALSIMPGMSVSLGGFLVQHFDWPSCFYFLTAYYIFLLWLVRSLPETHPHHLRTVFSLASAIKQYGKIMHCRTMWSHALTWGGTAACLYLFAANAPIIVITALKKSPSVFGMLNLLPAVGMVLGMLLARKLAHTLSGLSTMMLGWGISFVGAVGLMWVLFYSLSTAAFFLTALVLYIGLPMMFANASVLSTEHIKDKATGNAFVSTVVMGLPVLALAITGSLHASPENILAESMLLMVVMCAATIAGAKYLESRHTAH